jgi:hypothetical protein
MTDGDEAPRLSYLRWPLGEFAQPCNENAAQSQPVLFGFGLEGKGNAPGMKMGYRV